MDQIKADQFKRVIDLLLADERFRHLHRQLVEQVLQDVMDKLTGVVLGIGDAVVKHPDFAAIQEQSVEKMIRAYIKQIDRVANDTLYTPRRAAEFLGISRPYLSKLHNSKKGPPSRGRGRWLRYRRGDLVLWQAEQGK